MEHALLFCSWTRPVWFGLQIQCVPHSVGFTNLAKWFVDSFDKFQGGKDYVMFGGISLACALWVIWKSRNLGVFKGMKPNPMTILIQINTLVNDYLRLLGTKVQNREGHSSRRRFNSQWRPPPKGWHKINVDTSFLLPTGIVISGVVVRDEKGNLLTGCYRRHVAHSSLMAEALAIRDGMVLATSLSLEKVLLESDNLEVIQACRREIMRGEIRAILEDIWKLKQELSRCGFTWTRRQGNELAHQIAALGRSNRLNQDWTYNIPSSIKSILRKDQRSIRVEGLEEDGYLTLPSSSYVDGDEGG